MKPLTCVVAWPRKAIQGSSVARRPPPRLENAPAAGPVTMPRSSNRHGNKVRVLRSLDPHQHVVLAAGFGRLLIGGRTNAVAVDVEDHVLQPVLRRGPF